VLHCHGCQVPCQLTWQEMLLLLLLLLLLLQDDE
jgi:hypothetical protein